MAFTSPFLVVLGTALAAWWYTSTRLPKRLPYPPGPKPHFLWKNLFDLPQVKPWLTYEKWKKEYGDIVHLSIAGRHLLILNSMKVASDLLDKRSSKYSDRPKSVMTEELMGLEYTIVIKSNTPAWRAQRRLIHQFLREKAVGQYNEAQERHVHAFLRRLCDTPPALQDHIRLLFAGLVLDVTYNIKVSGHEDIFVKTAEEAVRRSTSLINGGFHLVDLIPALKYIPSWFPGAEFKRKAAKAKTSSAAVKDKPFAHVKKDIANGTARASMTASMLSLCEEEALDGSEVGPKMRKEDMEELVASTAGTIYGAASDTTLSAFQMFFLLMAKHPYVQAAAQSELDDLLGPNRLPTFADMDSLPYIQAIVKELLRWHPVAPQSIPHALAQDDIYEGYFIPKGTIVIPNCWGMLQDPETYPNPERFNPSRWLTTDPEGWTIINPSTPDPMPAIFGFGRRVCPGQYFALNSLFLVVSCTLRCFNISPASGTTPEELPVEVAGEMISYPLPYNVQVTPRSASVERLIGDLPKED